VPSKGRCPACGAPLLSEPEGLASGDARVFNDEPGDLGVRLDDGSTACPVTFGPYRVLGLIGKGGMGLVYHAIHETTREEVAIKTVRVRKRGMLHRIRREILALARIKHPGLVRIIETGQSQGQPWYAMELLRGPTLQALLIQRHPSPPRSIEPERPDSSGWDTRADFILDLGSFEVDPSLKALSDRETRTFGLGEILSPSKLETVDQAKWSDSKAPTTDEIPVSPEAPTVALPMPTGNPTGASTVEVNGDSDCIAGSSVGRPPPQPIPEGPLRDFLILMSRLCGTLAYLHGMGVVHRDVKPQNVIILPDGTPVLLDFGLASYFGACGRESLEIGGKIEGTPEYMSPEQIRGEFVDARADLYSFGCILYEVATGKVPFRAKTAGGTLRAHVKSPPIPPRDLNPEIPEVLSDLILHLLAKKSSDRLGYARDVVAVLDRLGCAGPEWATDSPSRNYLYRPRFVGRAATVTLIEKYVRRAIARPGHCIFLKGQSGVGKTRFIMELARQFEQGGLAVVTGECLPIGVDGLEDDGGLEVRAKPLHPFRPFLQVVADCCLERGPQEVARLLGSRASVLAECEPSLANLPGSVDDVVVPTQPEPEGSLQSRLIEAMGETLHEFGRNTPVVLFLDDLQWADSLTLHFLALFHVGVWDCPNVAIVAAYRSEDEHDALTGYRPVFQDATFATIGPLEEDSLGEIIRDMLGSNEVEDRFVGHVARRSGGNPFFVAEYLRAAVAEGLLYRDDAGCWRPRRFRSGDVQGFDTELLDVLIPLPDSLHDLVVRRLAGLSDEARQLLELAAIFGREVDADLLDAVGLLDERRTMTAIEALIVAQVLEESRDSHFRFVHDLLREVAYEQIPPTRRRSLHRSVALALESRHEGIDELARNSATLAHHWYRSIGDRHAEPEAVDSATAYLEASIRQAVNSGLSGQAVEYGRAAARLLDIDVPESPAAIASALTAEMDRIGQLLGDRSPSELLSLPISTDPRLNQPIELLLTIQPPAFLSNQIRLFALMASKNLTMTLEHGLGPLAPSVFAMYALVARIVLDDPRTAREFAASAVELDRRGGGTQTADVLFLKAWFVDHWVFPIRDLLPECTRGAQIGMDSGEVLYGCYNHVASVSLLAASGEPLDRVIKDADLRLAQVGRRVLIARFHCVLERQVARALAGQTIGPTSLSDNLFDETRDLAFICRTTNASQMGYYHVARLKLHYYQGEYREALNAADQALDVAEAFGRQPVEIDLVFFRALALLAIAGHEPESRRAAAEHLATLARWREHCEANFAHKALLVEAELARVEGRSEDARRLYEAAARSAEAFNFTPHAALAHELAARHLLRIGENAASTLQAAIDGYRAWGAKTLADRLAEN
jgi:predicted ATPase/serine/threonine protein kinase